MADEPKENKEVEAPPMPQPFAIPILPLQNTTLFPETVVPLSVGRDRSIAAVESSLATEEKLLGCITTKTPEVTGDEAGDPRITRVGRLLRRVSIDEVPQLWNVLRGEMSLVGPRPTLAYQVEQYSDRQRRRLEVKPGITGWAQVNGRARLQWNDRIELDVWYVENRSPWVDLKILARTPMALFTGTYKGKTGGWRA